MQVRRIHRPALAAVAVFVAAAAAAALAAESRSAPVAKELSQALDAAKLDAIAAPDPANAGTFVAALYFQGSQLLVVSAKYSAPTLLVDKVAKKEYRDIYMDLHSASIAGTRVFIQDQLADGLASDAGGDRAADSIEENNKTIVFDDDERKKAKMSEADFQKAYADADERYTRMLTLLLAQAKK